MNRTERYARRERMVNVGKSSKISLAIKRNNTPKEITKAEGPIYPSLHIDNVKLPVDKEDIGKTMPAIVTLKFTQYGERNSDGKENCNYSFDIRDIKFIG